MSPRLFNRLAATASVLILIGLGMVSLKRVLRKYNGIDRKSFPLFLKECEFRFNFGTPSQQI